MMYAFAPGHCGDRRTQIVPTQLEEDLANFLLIRGDYAFLGHGWLGCSKFYHFPPELNLDYGTPRGLCRETAEGSEVFVREWSKSTVQMDCRTYTANITMKPAGRLVESHSS